MKSTDDMILSKNHFYYSFEKIDAHVHHNLNRTALLEAARQEKFKMLTINTDIPDFIDIEKQRNVAIKSASNVPGMLNFITTFTTEGWGSNDWVDKAIEQIKTGWQKGAVAVKIWKNIGMELQDEQGNFVMVDHSSLDPVINYLQKNKIPLAAHLGEPKNCWLPMDKMTVTSDREYFLNNPKYHMYLHVDYPSYEDQLRARDNMLNKFPELRFIGLHLASLEWSIDKIGEWLDTFPNAGVDLAERVCHLQYQAIENSDKVKEFVEAYQDRIIYGSDQIDNDLSISADEIKSIIQQKWQSEFRFFSDDGIQTAWNVPKPFKGLGISKKILKKIFRDNATRYYPRLS